MVAVLAVNLLSTREIKMSEINQLNSGNFSLKNNPKSYKYVHIWSSKEEIRVRSTDPQILEVFTRAIERSDPDCEIDTRKDLTDQGHIVKITQIESPDRYSKIAWWLFKMLCERGWEPMGTGENWYKMKYFE